MTQIGITLTYHDNCAKVLLAQPLFKLNIQTIKMLSNKHYVIEIKPVLNSNKHIYTVWTCHN